MHYLYRITNLINQKVYLGQTMYPKKRWNNHKYEARKLHPEFYLHKAIAKYGVDNFIFEIIAQSKIQEDANEIEADLIVQYDSRNPKMGYNIMPGGKIHSGYKHSDETKEKMRQIALQRGCNAEAIEGLKKCAASVKGVPRTDEVKEKIRLSSIGQKRSDESRKKMSESHKGKPSGRLGIKHSEESKEKMRKAYNGQYTNKTWKLIDGKRVWMDK
jgi:group I intron endonuclease